MRRSCCKGGQDHAAQALHGCYILCIPAAILGFFGLFIIFVDSVSYGAGLLVIAFLISPYGLPMLATWLLAKLHVLRYAIQDRIYG